MIKEINDILHNLNSTKLHPGKSLKDLTLCESGYIIFFMRLDKKYGCFPLNIVKQWDIPNITGQDLLDTINEHNRKD